jgi:hypothetical protein
LAKKGPEIPKVSKREIAEFVGERQRELAGGGFPLLCITATPRRLKVAVIDCCEFTVSRRLVDEVMQSAHASGEAGGQ